MKRTKPDQERNVHLIRDVKVNVNGDPKGLVEVSLINFASVILSRPEMLKRC